MPEGSGIIIEVIIRHRLRDVAHAGSSTECPAQIRLLRGLGKISPAYAETSSPMIKAPCWNSWCPVCELEEMAQAGPHEFHLFFESQGDLSAQVR